MLRKLIVGTAAVVLLGGPAVAADFTLDVPVSVQNVPLLTQVQVDCYVSVLPAGTTGAAADSNVIGRGSATVDAPGGTYEGTVTVAVENRGVLRSVDARSYHCDLNGRGRSPAGTDVALEGSWSNAIQRMTGSPLVSETTWTEANLR